MRNLKFRKNLFLFLLVLWITNSTQVLQAQVTIGSDAEPKAGALLDLKERTPTNPQTDNTTANGGMLYPRVGLTDKNKLYPMFENDGSGGYKKGTKTYVKQDEDRSHAGLVVFNITNDNGFTPGLYVWNGSEWRSLTDDPIINPISIVSLACESAVMVPAKYTAGSFFEGLLTVPYFGGSGGAYPGTASVSIGNGLNIERVAGRLAVGGGEVMYRIHGTPTVSSPISTDFPITFLGKTCDLSIGNSDVTSVYVKNLLSDVTINTIYTGPTTTPPSTAVTVPFEEIVISETGSYAFSVRLYGLIGTPNSLRAPFLIYLQKNTKNVVEDAAEIDVVTVAQTASIQDYSYSVTLGGYFEEGDKVIISMHRPNNCNWRLKQGSSTDRKSPIRTSLIYWKL